MFKVFIVEDETLLRELLSDYIGSIPSLEIVGSCGDGKKAVEQCIACNPDLVILDIILPGLNGIEVLERLKAHNSEFKVLLFSSLHNPRTVRFALQAGVDGYVDKVAGVDEFRKAVACIMDGEQYFSSTVKDVINEYLSVPESGNTEKDLTAREQEILASFEKSATETLGAEN